MATPPVPYEPQHFLLRARWDSANKGFVVTVFANHQNAGELRLTVDEYTALSMALLATSERDTEMHPSLRQIMTAMGTCTVEIDDSGLFKEVIWDVPR
jgi:hypothetical protein